MYSYKTKKYEDGEWRVHRRIMEDFLKRHLNSNEIVHHIDGNIYNNDIKNLEVLSRAEHLKKHPEIEKAKIKAKQKYFLNIKIIKKMWGKYTIKQMAKYFNCSTSPVVDTIKKYNIKKNVRKKLSNQVW